MNIATTGQNISIQSFGGNDDQYSGSGKIWEIARRFNQQSKAIQGHVTCVRRRQVKSVERVCVL